MGKQGAALFLQPLSVSTLDVKVATGNLRVVVVLTLKSRGNGEGPRGTCPTRIPRRPWQCLCSFLSPRPACVHMHSPRLPPSVHPPLSCPSCRPQTPYAHYVCMGDSSPGSIGYPMYIASFVISNASPFPSAHRGESRVPLPVAGMLTVTSTVNR